ncbi:uncharacterized protein L969DRAFT_96308 [Mixia osmundae IAM 14324]|uniref:Uncharacterized protein n=1 Tax=Mixia osmundae (strain CBS 9802 / IAM 14324 / JCM 22182 / KY 12970) TaxID=764103 RepID=G7E521_MIXOS|nr:uncharacterized protein L969DRAFT_96308 [Mixia osmundae IAM 14324]KEI37793.1 hypothetical protein L969DRAFT_96308 [Mixia osmundae IAM 14324]GAA97931.1 hypothetical protein E5Q_04611 [Mixia osmundae IAM 14324]
MSAQATQGMSQGATQGAAQGAAQGGQMDKLDSAVDTIMKKTGHTGNRQTVEKISDGIRSIYKKITGKNIPIADQN